VENAQNSDAFGFLCFVEGGALVRRIDARWRNVLLLGVSTARPETSRNNFLRRSDASG
jgi:hypothetical protein